LDDIEQMVQKVILDEVDLSSWMTDNLVFDVEQGTELDSLSS